MAHYIMSMWCLILKNMFKDLKYKNKEIHYNFTSILSSNNVKFSDYRFQEQMSRKLNVDYFKVPFISNLLCSKIININKTHIKQNAKLKDKLIKNPINSKTTKKKSKREEKEERFRNKYYCTDLFEFIRDSELDHKSIEKLSKISGMDSMWTDNDIITEFTSNIDTLIKNDSIYEAEDITKVK